MFFFSQRIIASNSLIVTYVWSCPMLSFCSSPHCLVGSLFTIETTDNCPFFLSLSFFVRRQNADTNNNCCQGLHSHISLLLLIDQSQTSIVR